MLCRNKSLFPIGRQIPVASIEMGWEEEEEEDRCI